MSYKMIKWGSSSDSKEKEEYFMDVNAFMETRARTRNEGFQHPCHDHLLELELREVFLDSTKDKDVICNGCGLFIRGCAFYTCSTLDCVFNLHEFCAHLPQNMTHLIHDEHIHKLTPLFVDEYVYSKYSRCNICDKIVYQPNGTSLDPDPKDSRICYHCCEHNCIFLVDFGCIASVLPVKDPGHRHPLTPHLYPASFLCSICGEKNDDKESLSYICHECPFWVHDRCFPLLRTIQHPTHPHPLSMMTFYFAYPFLMKCGICGESLEDKYWLYSCRPCSYAIHVKCSFKESIEMVLLKLDEEEVKSMTKLFFPNKKSVHQTLTQLVRKLCKTKEEESSGHNNLLLHHSNHDCPLVICEKIDDDNNQVCDACVLPICEPPFYACLTHSCKFFLHKWCVNLPKEWKFTHHDPQHILVLMEKKTDGFGFHRCRMCENVGNGFFFKCTKCEDYYIDIKCASLPNSIMHDTNDHSLLLLKTREHPTTSHATCYCCVDYLPESEYVYGCVCCHLFLHVGCLWIPQKMEHWYDEHPFSLVYKWPMDISEDGLDYYFCEFCEINIRNDYWFYHCSECNQSSHISCLGRDLYPMLKFGLCYVLSSIHQHPLTCVKVRTIDIGEDMVKPCSFCHDPTTKRTRGWEEMIFECLICKILLHPECVDHALHCGWLERGAPGGIVGLRGRRKKNAWLDYALGVLIE